MRRLVMAVIAACSMSVAFAAEDITNEYSSSLTGALAKCRVYLVQSSSTFGPPSMRVVRCPNSTTEAIHDNPKLPDVNVIIDGVEYVKKEK